MRYSLTKQPAKVFITRGKEYMTLNGSEYTGYVHMTNSNILYTGKIHDNTSKLLYPYTKNSDIITYRQITSIDRLYNKIKLGYNPVLSKEDKSKSNITRYIASKRNDMTTYEISKQVYDKLGSNNFVYKTTKVKWKIKGALNDVYSDDGTLIEHGVYDTNKRTIMKLSAEFPKINTVMTNYTQLYISD